MRIQRVSRWLGLVAVAAAATMVLVACGGGSDEGGSTLPVATAPNGGGGSSPAATKPSSGGSQVVVQMTDNKFTPNKIEVKVNEPVTFVAKNEGAAVHNMKVLSKSSEGKDYSSDALVNPGTESKFTVTFKKAGTVKFQCDYHLPDMAGTIEVK